MPRAAQNPCIPAEKKSSLQTAPCGCARSQSLPPKKALPIFACVLSGPAAEPRMPPSREKAPTSALRLKTALPMTAAATRPRARQRKPILVFPACPHHALDSEKRRRKARRMRQCSLCDFYSTYCSSRFDARLRKGVSAGPQATARTTAAGEDAASPSANRGRCPKSADARAAAALRSLPPVGRFADGGPDCRPVQTPLPP